MTNVPWININQPVMSAGQKDADAAIGGDSRFIQVKDPENMETKPGVQFVYTLPEDTFIDSDPDGVITVQMRIKEAGVIKDLPNWLTFDNTMMQVRGVVPSDAADLYILRAIGRDQWGNEAAAEFEVRVR